MRLPRECYQMQQVIETHLPHFSRPQLTGLVLWVVNGGGIVDHCGGRKVYYLA